MQKFTGFALIYHKRRLLGRMVEAELNRASDKPSRGVSAERQTRT